MNFLRQSFSSISEPPSLPPQNNNANHPALHHHTSESDRDTSQRALHSASAFDSDGEDARLPVPSPADSLRTRNRVPIEDHVDVLPDGGGILIPSRELPKDWHAHGDMSSVMGLDRCFVFPGEHLSILVYISSHDPSMPEIVTPFRVSAMMDKAELRQKEMEINNNWKSETTNGEGNKHPFDETMLQLEEQKNKSAALLQLFQNSHLFTRISGVEEQLRGDHHHSEETDDGSASTNSSETKKSTELTEPVPILMEGGDFEPQIAGGVARDAKCYSFGNGDIAVLLQVTVATDLKGDVMLEVLQFEQPGKFCKSFDHRTTLEATNAHHYSQSTMSSELLQWLLPLDNAPSAPPPNTASGSAATSVNSSPQRPSLTNSSSSSLFSFANLRTYSSGSFSHIMQTPSAATPPHLSSTHGLDGWASRKSSKGQSAPKEGLLSFRGTHLEPQRFSVHCGLEGLYVPGWRWRRNLEIVEPVAIESYFADCNTKDLICVSIENVVPEQFPQINVIVDSITIVCQTPNVSSTPSAVPISCVEVGENHELPGLSLRPGEQHSFILKPSTPSPNASNSDISKSALLSTSYGHNMQATKASSHHSSTEIGKMKAKEQGFSHDSSSYVIVVSCRCSHTESRLHFKHPIKWRPRTPRDLLLSVSVETAAKSEIPNGSLPSFVPKVVTVQATNLTSECLHLTLLAPSSMNSGSSLLTPVLSSSGLARMSSFMSFSERKEWPVAKAKEAELERDRVIAGASPSGRPSMLQRSLSLPPARPIESIMGITPRVVKERAISAADIAADNTSARTHLWLQSIIPLGSVPSKSTTAIKCELLPLTDGIITLDTLHISTKERDVYYPEQPLQIYATSSIGIGIP